MAGPQSMATTLLPTKIPSGNRLVCSTNLVLFDRLTNRSLMGVCPQHDILWDELTAAEHLKIFAQLKGFPPHVARAEAEEKLEYMGLLDVAHNVRAPLTHSA